MSQFVRVGDDVEARDAAIGNGDEVVPNGAAQTATFKIV